MFYDAFKIMKGTIFIQFIIIFGLFFGITPEDWSWIIVGMISGITLMFLVFSESD